MRYSPRMIQSAAGRLRFLRERSAYRSAAKFARHIGVPEVTYRAHESGLRGFGEPQARRYAEEMGANWVWLLTGEGAMVAGDADRVPELPGEGPSGFEIRSSSTRPALLPGRDLPVYASAEGGPSGMTVVPDDSIAIDWVPRPEPLAAVRDAFAVYVIGDSMEPRYEQGDMIFAHPSRPWQRDDDVLLLAQGGNGERAALIKRLVRWTPEMWTVRQYNPPRELDLARVDWQTAYVVVGKYNRR